YLDGPWRRSSSDTQFLLQAGRGGGVLEAQLLVRPGDVERGLSHQRRLMEARQYQLQLARIGIDVADGENSRRLAFEPRRVHGNQILVEMDAEFGDGAKFDGEAEEGQEGVRLMMPFALVGAR